LLVAAVWNRNLPRILEASFSQNSTATDTSPDLIPFIAKAVGGVPGPAGISPNFPAQLETSSWEEQQMTTEAIA
jgi:hypothetical protein